MLSLDGYAIRDCIQRSPQSEVYTGSRQSDGLRVVLKVYLSRSGSSRAKREFALLQRIESPGVVRPVDLVQRGERCVLIVERFPGHPLARRGRDRRLSVPDVLQIALSIAHALADVHDARIIHKDVKLANILINPERNAICLVDFGISDEFGRAEQSAPPEEVEGTFAYIAPEQTGRVALGLDFRTDLYSLGASLYELLAGRPPFADLRGSKLITAHLSVRPRPLAELDSRVPLALSRIVDKLLEKDPELRYQTARGLAADLELCQKQWQTAGFIEEDLTLGVRDASDRLRFPNRIYGRERERAALHEALDRVSQGGLEWIQISGVPGIGKSALPGLLRGPVAQRGGLFAEASSQSDAQGRPYAGFATLLRSLVDQLLCESSDRLSLWRHEIRAELGAIGAALSQLVPGLSLMIPDFPALPPLAGQEARERLALAVTRLVRVLARREHPLVLFFDDLQWADAGSLFLLSALLRSGESEALLVIGSDREGEIAEAHPLARLMGEAERSGVRLQRWLLQPLGLEDTSAILADALGRSAEETEALARRLGPKCQYNPLLLRRLIFHLWDRDLIRHDHAAGWVWDERGLIEADVTDDAAAMLAAQIDALPARAQQLLQVASLIGRSFELELLVGLSGGDRFDLLQQIMVLVDHGVLAPCSEGFKFGHDRLRETARARLSAEERVALHHRAAMLLLERTPSEELPAQAFRIADHLTGALPKLSDEERRRAIDVFGLAATQALAEGASETAMYYADHALGLLDPAEWRDRFERVLGIALTGAEAAFQASDFDRALEILDDLEPRPLLPLQRAQVLAKRASVYNIARPDEAVSVALDALQRFGVRLPPSPSRLRMRLDIWRTDWCLRGPAERMFPEVSSADMGWLAPVVIIAGVIGALSHRSQRLSGLSATYVLRAFRAHGAVRSPGMVLAGYTAVRIAALRHTRGVDRYVRAALYWMERFPDAVRDVRATVLLHAFVYSWLRPRRSVLRVLGQAAGQAREMGDLEYSTYASAQHAALCALSGEPLRSVSACIAELDRVSQRSGDPFYRNAFELTYGRLQDPEAGPVDVEEGGAAIRSSPRPNADVFVGVHWVATLCMMGEFEAAAAELEHFGPRIESTSMIGSAEVDYCFYSGMCESALAQAAAAASRRRPHLRALRRCVRRVRRWARISPDFAHMLRLLEAEELALRGRMAPALRAYRDAAHLASRAGYAQHAALCHQSRARALERQRRDAEAVAALSAATALYREWGALRVVRLLESQIEERDVRSLC